MFFTLLGCSMVVALPILLLLAAICYLAGIFNIYLVFAGSILGLVILGDAIYCIAAKISWGASCHWLDVWSHRRGK